MNPDGVTSIECIMGNDITSVTLPEGVTTISDYMFSGCKNLTSVKLSSSIINIGKGAFRDCTSLTEIIIPDGVTSIEDETFQNCAFLTKADLPEGLTSIGDYAFAYCELLSECTIPESVTSIGASAFARTGITSAVIPEGITDIGALAFTNCTALESVTIPKSVVTIEDGVEIIDDGAFYNCKGVTEFNFPASVRYIGKEALYGTSNGVTITILNPLCEIDNSSYTVPYNAKIVAIPIPLQNTSQAITISNSRAAARIPVNSPTTRLTSATSMQMILSTPPMPHRSSLQRQPSAPAVIPG